MSQWIAVDDRLPPEPDDTRHTFLGSKVLVWTAGKEPTWHTAHYLPSTGWLVHTDYFSTGHPYTVTHWMPLPEPPQTEMTI